MRLHRERMLVRSPNVEEMPNLKFALIFLNRQALFQVKNLIPKFLALRHHLFQSNQKRSPSFVPSLDSHRGTQ